MSIKKSMSDYLDNKYNKFKNIAYKNPDDDIRVYPLPTRSYTKPCSACGSTVSVKYFFMDRKDKSHLLCNRCAAIRDFSCAYENSGTHTKEQFEKVQKEINEFSKKPEVVNFDFKSMYPSELRFNDDGTIEKAIPEEDDNDEEKKYVYVYCTKYYNLQLNLDTINELIDEIITSIELDSKTMETTILDIYEYRDTAYVAMCLDYHSMITRSDNHISGSRRKDYMYDIKYVYDMNTGDLDVYMVYKKEVI